MPIVEWRTCLSQGRRLDDRRQVFWILSISGNNAMALVSGEDGVIDFRRARMWLFFHEVGNCAKELEAVIRAVRWGRITELKSLSIATEILSEPQLLEYKDLMAVGTWLSVTGEKENWLAWLIWGSGESSISWRSDDAWWQWRNDVEGGQWEVSGGRLRLFLWYSCWARLTPALAESSWVCYKVT